MSISISAFGRKRSASEYLKDRVSAFQLFIVIENWSIAFRSSVYSRLMTSLITVRCSRRPRTRTSKRSEEHTSELQSLMRISYAVFCLKKKKPQHQPTVTLYHNQDTNKCTI